ncbi:hypothetical protein [Candidatus Methylobacter oryzae]|uniref:Transposase n=1 Tax=Candidatus Methylobacter oryzae TaxID=2497749 RepID=A0ABY3CCJ3_9GAMM|nr:hypothetical protein [Candidatus Methylobacter oryzae]TRW97124.1 hypothetical protein EKO24_007910 [Candidatus Methylobacter oryzae]
MPQDCLEQSRLTAKDGGNAARLPGAIAATTSLWVMQEVESRQEQRSRAMQERLPRHEGHEVLASQAGRGL